MLKTSETPEIISDDISKADYTSMPWMAIENEFLLATTLRGNENYQIKVKK